MSSFPGGVGFAGRRPVSARSGKKEFINRLMVRLTQVDAVLPADTVAPWYAPQENSAARKCLQAALIIGRRIE